MSQKIWVTGDAVVDLIPDGENHYLRCAGGAPANVAVGVARLGSPSAFIGRVGNDPLGKFMQDTLNAENVNTQHMILDPQHRTSTVIVGLDNGERSFTFMVNPSADQFLQASDLPPFQQGEWLHCCSIALINNPSREATFEGEIGLATLLKEAGLVPSTSEAIRSAKQGGVKINGEKVEDMKVNAPKGTNVYQVGKRKFARVTIA